MSAETTALPAPRGPRSRAALASLCIAAGLAFCLLVALGSWQFQRRAWKLDLIERVQARLAAPPVALPAAGQWPAGDAVPRAAEYTRVVATGRLLQSKTALVQASTRLGPGFWVMVPLAHDAGGIAWINRGFVPPEARAALPRTGEPHVQVTGLLRVTEPGGSLLRSNVPAEDRWYSRDVAALSAARGLQNAGPVFVDEAEVPGAPEWPRGGLTVVAFPNNHLVYAITWYALALMVAAAAVFVWRDERRRRASGGAA